MGKQTKLLEYILFSFQEIELSNDIAYQDFNKTQIKVWFKRSLNKNEIIRRILNDVVLSNDEIVSLLRIIYKKKESKK